MRVIYLILFYFVTVLSAAGQYIPTSTQSFQYAPIFNPAFAGVDAFTDLRLGYRYQWAGFQNAPTMANMTFTTRLKQPFELTSNALRIGNTEQIKSIAIPKRKLIIHGFGANVFYESNSVIKRTGAGINYALNLALSKKLRLAFGIGALIDNVKVDLSVIDLKDPDSYYDMLVTNGADQTDINVRAGMLLYAEKVYFGISYLPLVNSPIQTSDVALNEPYYRASAQFGFSFNLAPAFEVKPSVVGLLQMNNTLLIDYSVKGFIKDKTWFGLSYRDIGAAGIILGFNLNEKLGVAYSYEISTSGLREFNDGSHELVLSLRLKNYKREYPYTW